ncbi:hypothetical protein TWF225_011082 [Orbilia oligospora]|uniref:Uncharacterized protein n=1 Tax=Orbilia oligospora TaxID=2813651 RepID=A0A7C8PBB0_ORBOL|nr:hypothetical protein TWF751_011188 [Orbilia oligospora]KAF3170254.1 hypothetical protein TWF225_011082 [Orbilia oligospora]KAF3238968.1 hypothetical protein TWF217_001622 [Orbilia oligospora]KAF3242290.1 hypothetical protein TWF128_010535 [Orbilia oligospora]KAF3282589.1 hypothetical protein TWF132_010612 [Orbilia oligospora]
MASKAPIENAKRDPTAEELLALFRDVQESFPKALGEERWYLMLFTTLTYALPDPTALASLYTYLISLPQYSTPSSRQALIRRIREALVKVVSLIGVAKPLLVIWTIATIEREEDRDFSFTRKDWKCDSENLENGLNWLNTIYRGDSEEVDRRFRGHDDFRWISYNITYGLYLSDHSVLDPVESELVVLCGLLIQNLAPVTAFHLRGLRRVGVKMEDVEAIHVCCEKVARVCGIPLDKVPRVADIEHLVPWEQDKGTSIPEGKNNGKSKL